MRKYFFKSNDGELYVLLEPYISIIVYLLHLQTANLYIYALELRNSLTGIFPKLFTRK